MLVLLRVREPEAPLPEPDPLILTAALDPASAERFETLRDAHFPARLNIVPAHLTLFHHLPGAEWRAIDADLRGLCADEAPIAFTVPGLRFLGRGVALEIEAARLVSLRKRLATTWQSWLTPQDAQGFRPHVTVQNKVDPAEARALRDRLAAAFPTIAGTVTGLALWHYRGGPWEAAGRFAFDAATNSRNG